MPRACPIRRSPALNAEICTGYSRGTPRSDAPSGWGLGADQKRAQKPLLERMPRTGCSARSAGTKLADTRPAGTDLGDFRPVCRHARRSNRLNFAAPKFLRATSHWSNSKRSYCRYPYGGDEEGEAITFCGHPRRKGSSYCTPHFHLTRNPDIPTGAAGSTAMLRLLRTADEIFETVMERTQNGTNEAQEALQAREDARPAIAGSAAQRGGGAGRGRRSLRTEPGDKIVTLRSIRNDLLAACTHIGRSTKRSIRAAGPFRTIGRRAERGPRAVDPTRENVDGGQSREPITEGQRKAVLRLNRVERELGADGRRWSTRF